LPKLTTATLTNIKLTTPKLASREAHQPELRSARRQTHIHGAMRCSQISHQRDD
jgi:hypothetical protein